MSDNLLIITGSSSGLGRALVEVFLSEAWTVLGMARRALTFNSDHYQHLQVDLSDPQAPELLAEPIARVLGSRPWRQIVLINNAATLGEVKPLRQLSWDDLNRSFRLNACLPIWLMQQVQALESDSLLRWYINISSGAATKAYPGWTAYCASKAALQMALQVAAAESKFQSGDQYFVSYAPGVLDTPMQSQLRQVDQSDFPPLERFIKLHEDGALLPPDQPANDIYRLIQAPHERGLSRQQPYLETRYQGV